MPDFSYIGEPMLVTAQEQHAVTANEAIEALAKGAGSISVSVAAGNVELTEDQSRAGVILLTGAPGTARVVTMASGITRAVLFRNDTTGGQTIEVEQFGGTNFPVPPGGAVLLLSTTQAITIQPRGIESLAFNDAELEWTDQPAGVTEFPGTGTFRRLRYDLTTYQSARLIVNVSQAGHNAPAKLRAQWSADQMTWDYLDGSAGPSVDLDTTGLKVSGWVNLENDARIDAYLRLVGLDGNGTADPRFQLVALQFR